jgi:nitric oxide reductase subunit B
MQPTDSTGERSLSPWWRHGALLVMIFGFSVLTVVTVFTYSNAPPIPRQVVDPAGRPLFTGDEIEQGQEVFLKRALMEHGTLWGHGAYLGPDFTAEHLHRETEIARDTLATDRFGKPFEALPPADRSAVEDAVRAELKVNRYDPAAGTLTFSAGEAAASRALEGYWTDYFTRERSAPGLAPGSIPPAELRLLNTYFSWATWATVTNRPGKAYTYTNNWPYDPDAGNRPSTQAYVWSALSLVALLGGLGLVLLIFGKFHFLGWGGEHDEPRPVPPAPMALTPSQRAVGKYLVVVGLLFLLQTVVGGALAHYRAEPFSFYGLDAIVRLAPYNLLRTYHLQLAIFWIATAWVAGGLFLAPLVGGEDPPGQRLLVDVLFWALVLVVGGSLTGEFLGVTGRLERTWFWLGHQGSEYLDLGRFWQLLLAAGLVLWLTLMFRALRPAIRRKETREVSALFLYAATAIPLFYLPALFYGPRSNFAVIDN